MPKFVNMVANKSKAELDASPSARLHLNHSDRSEKPPMNPVRNKPDPFAPKAKGAVEPRKVSSPAVSALRGQLKEAPKEPTNAEIMAFLLKNFPNAK